ncbi:MAG: GNAT family N-acetyltransferase [Thermoplasmata archaeon]
MELPSSTRGAPADELLELAQLMQRELLLREEAPSRSWVEGTATELRAGEKMGWYYPLAAGGGLAFRSDRGATSYAHVHVGPGPDALPRAIALAETLLDSVPASVTSVSAGFTGLPTDVEEVLLARLSRRVGSTVIRRHAMERALTARDGEPLAPPPDALRLVPVREVTPEALAALDQRSFSGTVDELLIGTDLTDYRRALDALLDSELGQFLDAASTTLYRADPPTLVGAILSCEKSARRAVVLDFMVDPALRGRGYGKYLFRWTLRSLCALGYERVRLWVSASNRPARQLYDQIGFSVTHTAAIYRWDRVPPTSQRQSAR